MRSDLRTVVFCWLVDRTGSNMSPALYVVAAAVITLLTLLTMRETARQPLRTTGDSTDRPLVNGHRPFVAVESRRVGRP